LDFTITVNEKKINLKHGVSISQLHKRIKPDADIMILNGAPIKEDFPIKDGDIIVFIKKGEFPNQEELEALLVARHTPGVHAKVKKAVIGIAGAGGLGSQVAIALTRLGIGKLIIADHDIVEPSNLNRQQYFIEQIGMKKVDALDNILQKINPYVKIIKHFIKIDRKNIIKIFKSADILVEAFDSPESKSMLAESYSSEFPDKPIILASGLASYYSNNDIKTSKISKTIYVVGDLMHEAGTNEGLMAPRVGIAAHHQANLVLRLIMGENL